MRWRLYLLPGADCAQFVRNVGLPQYDVTFERSNPNPLPEPKPEPEPEPEPEPIVL